MIGRRRISLWLLVALVGAPAALLLLRSVHLFRPQAPVLLTLVDGRRILSLPLPPDPYRTDDAGCRFLRSDGEVETIGRSAIATRETAPDAWVIRTEEGRYRVGWIRGLVVPDGDTLRDARSIDRIGVLREELELDRRERMAELDLSTEMSPNLSARSRWGIFERLEARTGLVLGDADGSNSFLRLSSVREMVRVPDTRAQQVLDWARRMFGALLDSSDRWGGGGLRQAGLSTLVLILLSGTVGGTLALLAALLLSERLRAGRWARVVRRTTGWLAAVPGIVWGVVGFGLLVPVLGGQLDALAGLTDRWSEGGLLWSALTLGILAAPLSMRRALDVLDTVPLQWRLLARSCGATRWQVLRMVVFPAAWRGLAGAWLSAFARAAGETAPLLLVGAIHSDRGVLVPVADADLSLSGGFLQLGAMAYDPVWSEVESAMGHPTAHLALLVLTGLCIGFELLASGFLGRDRRGARHGDLS